MRCLLLVTTTPQNENQSPVHRIVAQVKIKLSESLNALKHKISKCPTLIASAGGNSITPNHQRVFHLGRELKSGKRSLSVLGIGKYNAFLVHLMSNQPEPLELSSDDEEEDGNVAVVIASPRKKRKEIPPSVRGDCGEQFEEVVDVVDDDDDGEVVEVTRGEATIRQGQEGWSGVVVDLLESDDDVIEVQPYTISVTNTDTTFKRQRII